MTDYGFKIGRGRDNSFKTLRDLEEDLVFLIRSNGANFVFSLESNDINIENRTSYKQKITNYEVPNEGCISMILSDYGNLGPNNQIHKFHGIVQCLGFDESKTYFQKLNLELTKLLSVYSPDRISKYS